MYNYCYTIYYICYIISKRNIFIRLKLIILNFFNIKKIGIIK